jgi:8-oxo-dGTP diphosphatase
VVDHFHDGGQAVLIDYAARWTGGEPMAGDDAAEAAFVSIAEAMRRLGWVETRRVVALAVERFAPLA